MRLELSCSCSEAPAGRKALLKQRKNNLAPIPSVFHVFCTKHTVYGHQCTFLTFFIATCPRHSVCLSCLALMGTSSAKAHSSWSFSAPPHPPLPEKWISAGLFWLCLTAEGKLWEMERERLMLDNTGVYIVLFSQSCELLVFCERNRIPTNETSHCSCSQAPCGPLPMHFLYLSTPLRPAQLNNLQHPQFLRISPEAF